MIKRQNVKIGFLTQEQADISLAWTEEDAKEYVKLALKDFKKDENREMFFYRLLRAVKWIGVSKISKLTGLSRVCIYNTLDGTNTNPSIDTLSKILSVLGIKISFEFEKESASANRKQSGNYAFL